MKIIFLLASIFFIIGNGHAQEVVIVTEDLPPYQMIMENGKIGGFATEIVQAIFEETGTSPEINIYPWARAYKIALEEENVLIFSIVRSQQREPLFKWLAEITELRYYFYGLQSRKNIQIQSIEQAMQYQTGVSRDSVEHQELQKRGFNNLEIVIDQTQLLDMLFLKRFDFLLSSELPVFAMAKESTHDHRQLKKFYEVEEMRLKLYIAFSLKTSDEVVAKYRKAYESMKFKNIDRTIKEKWFGKEEEEKVITNHISKLAI